MSYPPNCYFLSYTNLKSSTISFSVGTRGFTWVAAPDKFAQIARAMGEEVGGLPLNQAAQKAVEAVRRLAADIQIPKLRDLVKEEDFRRVVVQMAKDGLASGTPQVNPRVPTEKEVVELFNLVYDYK